MTSKYFQLSYGVNFNDDAKRTATFNVLKGSAVVHTFSITGKQAKLADRGEKVMAKWVKANKLNAADYRINMVSI